MNIYIPPPEQKPVPFGIIVGEIILAVACACVLAALLFSVGGLRG